MRAYTFPISDVPAGIGAALRERRLSKGWSQAKLAQRSGVSRGTIALVERSTRSPRADTVLRLLSVLLGDDAATEQAALIPAWPESDATRLVGHGPCSRERRRELGLTLADVAAATGLSEATISRFERNAGPTPSIIGWRTSDHGDAHPFLLHEGLAIILGFDTVATHERFCAAREGKGRSRHRSGRG
ncbi:helix-turn-helix domain-containing protein [bacterium]|nr:MAG: helix-turn-helix domain-containing protein [bacterium]